MDVKSPYIQIDALTCRKRFHCRVLSHLPNQERVTFHCPECRAVLWEGQNCPPIAFLRHENLISDKDLSPHQTYACRRFDEPIQ